MSVPFHASTTVTRDASPRMHPGCNICVKPRQFDTTKSAGPSAVGSITAAGTLETCLAPPIVSYHRGRYWDPPAPPSPHCLPRALWAALPLETLAAYVLLCTLPQPGGSSHYPTTGTLPPIVGGAPVSCS